MSVVDQLKNLFTKNASKPEQDDYLSLAMPDVMTASMATEQMPDGTDDEVLRAVAARRCARSGGAAEESTDLITLPFLDRKSVV